MLTVEFCKIYYFNQEKSLVSKKFAVQCQKACKRAELERQKLAKEHEKEKEKQLKVQKKVFLFCKK